MDDGKLRVQQNSAPAWGRTGVLNEEKPKIPSGKKQNQNTLDMAVVVRDGPLPPARLLDSLTWAVYSFGRASVESKMAYHDPFLFLLTPVPQQPVITRPLFTQQGLTIATARRETLERKTQNRQH